MEQKVIIYDHPLIQHKLAFLRDKTTGSKLFRELVGEVSMLLCYEATRDLELNEIEVETPISRAKVNVIAGRKLALVSILRAGNSMADAMLNLVPAAKVGHIGLERDHVTHLPKQYFYKMPPDIEERDVYILDPMLATGGTAAKAVSLIKKEKPKSIKFICIVASPEGINNLSLAHPDVEIHCAAKDDHLNKDAYIVPGLGDAGDRLSGW